MGISIAFYKYAKNIPSLFIAFSSVVKANSITLKNLITQHKKSCRKLYIYRTSQP